MGTWWERVEVGGATQEATRTAGRRRQQGQWGEGGSSDSGAKEANKDSGAKEAAVTVGRRRPTETSRAKKDNRDSGEKEAAGTTGRRRQQKQQSEGGQQRQRSEGQQGQRGDGEALYAWQGSVSIKE